MNRVSIARLTVIVSLMTVGLCGPLRAEGSKQGQVCELRVTPETRRADVRTIYPTVKEPHK